MGDRAWSSNRSNKHWHNVVNKHGLVVKILEDNLTEEQAYEKEKQLIAEVGLGNLTNILEGGGTFTSNDANRLAQDPEWRKNVSEANRKKAQDPSWRRKQTENNRKLAQDPEWRKKVSDGVKRYWEQKRLMKS